MAYAQEKIIGKVTPPPGVEKWIHFKWLGTEGGAVPGLLAFLNAIIKLIIVAAGIYAFFNIIIAGYGFMSAGGDPKKVEEAWAKIWQSLIGLLIIAGSFVLAAIIGWLLFKDTTAILAPKIYGP